jgi:hypothetical protein
MTYFNSIPLGGTVAPGTGSSVDTFTPYGRYAGVADPAVGTAPQRRDKTIVIPFECMVLVTTTITWDASGPTLSLRFTNADGTNLIAATMGADQLTNGLAAGTILKFKTFPTVAPAAGGSGITSYAGGAGILLNNDQSTIPATPHKVDLFTTTASLTSVAGAVKLIVAAQLCD